MKPAGFNAAKEKFRLKQLVYWCLSTYAGKPTYSFGQHVLVRVIGGCALLNLLQQQWVLDQAAAGQIQEVPQVQLAAEG